MEQEGIAVPDGPAAEARDCGAEAASVGAAGDRLAALARYAILDTTPEPWFDNIAELLVDIFDAPMAAVGFVDSERVWLKAEVGVGVRQIPLDVAICAEALGQPGVFVIPDTLQDPRFARHAASASDFPRFYAGAPLRTGKGLPIGILCVLDPKPRPEGITARQQRLLHGLADQVTAQLELRRVALENAALSAELKAAHEIAKLGTWRWQAGSDAVLWSDQLYTIAGRGTDFRVTLASTIACIHPAEREATLRRLLDAVCNRAEYEGEIRIVQPDGAERWCWTRVRPVVEDDVVVAVNGICLDVTDRRRVDEQLRESEEHYRHSIELSPQMPWTADPAGNLLTISSRWLEWTGLSVEAALQQGWFGVVHPDDAPRAAECVHRSVITGDPLDLKVRFRRADGSYRWTRARGTARRDAQGRILRWYGATEDVHDQVIAEDKLRESRDLLQTVIDSVDEIILVKDREGRIVFVNRPPDTWPDAPADSCADGGAAALLGVGHGATDREVMRTGLRSSVEEMIRVGGEHRTFQTIKVPWRHDGEVLGIIGVSRDITERLQIEARLLDSEARLRLMQAAASIGGYDIDAAGRAICTREFLKLYGLPVTTPAVTFEQWLAQVHPDDRAWVVQQIQRVMTDGNRVDFEFRIVRADTGETRWVASRGKIQRNGQGRVVRSYGAQWDITARKLAEAALCESESLNRSIVEASIDCVKLLDLDGNLLFMNGPGRCAMEIDNFEELRGTCWVSRWPADARAAARQALDAARAGNIGRFSAFCPTAKGAPRWWDVVVSPVVGDAGQPIKLVCISRDMTQQKHIEDRIRWAAYHDQLTELPNRVLFHERLQDALAEAEAGGKFVGLFLLDVDRFKEVNDGLGHDAGDFLLRVFGARLVESVRSTDTVARLGGDEFAIILPGLSRREDMSPIAEAILARLREPVRFEGQLIDCHASIGGSVSPTHGRDTQDLIKCADTALYLAKSAGRGQFVLFEPAMRVNLQIKSSMISLAHEALRKSRIVPFYQPKVDLADGRIVGFEALLRWLLPGKGFQLPGAIAAGFDDLDLALSLGDRMLKQIVVDMRMWHEQGLAFGHVALNASAAELRSPAYASRVLEQLSAANIPPQWLELEVTEPVVLGRGADTVEATLKTLHDAGMSIALDDFGTGYASLAHLRRFPVNAIKIDRSFVGSFNEADDNGAIARAVISLGRGLGIRVVAEGVETAAQAAYLRAHGCAFGQGFLFGRPVPASEVAHVVDASQKNCSGK